MPLDSRLPRWAAAYLIVQAAAVLGWWVWILSSKPAREFFFTATHDKLLIGLVLPDLLFYTVGGAGAALAIRRNSAYMKPTLAVVTGGIAYATFFTLTLTSTTPNGWVSFGCMLPSFLVTAYLCRCAFRGNPT